jgi:hypothetical protein
MSRQNRGRIIIQIALVAVLLFVAIGLFLLRCNNLRQADTGDLGRVAVYNGGPGSGSAMGEATYYPMRKATKILTK